MITTDVLIIGSGLAAFTTALHLADSLRVTIVTKKSLVDSASDWAQGGIAAVLDSMDSLASHVEDTLEAGAGLCHRSAVEQVVAGAPEAIAWLERLHVPFTREESSGHLHLTREGGHSARRIVHATDATGHAVQITLLDRVRQHPNIQVLEQHIAVDLITGARIGLDPGRCYGCYVLDRKRDHVDTWIASHTVLATGGAGKVYLYTTNPDTSTGDGIAMAWRAGCSVANMEFVQFHPTCLYHPHAKSFLITEAVRGEGGLLRLPDGERFMQNYDARAELAPRDIVARAIDSEMKKRGIDCVYLDITHKDAAFIREHFPNIHQRCLSLGIDMTREPIPVVPAAHYTCGGVVVDLDARTGLDRLYAVGEVSHTGLHGANRLASNSLLECLVYGKAAARAIIDSGPMQLPEVPEWDDSRVADADEEVLLAHNWEELRRAMWDYVGIVRTDKRLARAARRISLLQEEIEEYYRSFRVSNDLIELRNLSMTAKLIVRSAQLRTESRGLHTSLDYPGQLPEPMDTVLHQLRRSARGVYDSEDGRRRHFSDWD